jgi:two-component system, sensor histidine kinase
MDPAVTRARAYMLNRQRPVLLFGNLAVMAVCAAVLWGDFPRYQVLAWVVSNVGLTAIRIRDLRRFNRERPTAPDRLERWMREFMFFTAIGGIIWGAGAVLFLDTANFILMMFVLTVFMGIGTGALPALCPHYGAFVAFVVPMFIPVVVKLLVAAGAVTNVLAGLMLFFVLCILYFAGNLSQAITDSITVDLENARLLDEVTLAKDAAERANAQKSGFLAAVSHDLRQPLYAMGLFLGSLDRDGLVARNRELIADIENAYVALEEMFGALLELSRLDAGAVAPQRLHFPLHELIARLLPEFEHAAMLKDIELVYEKTGAVVYSDPVLLERILRNLLSNAVKYTDEGRIAIEIVSDSEDAVVQIIDTGHGIAEHDLPQIFDEYHQLENPERDRTKGLGLGLSVVQRSCDLLGHRISVSSEPGKGSCFSVSMQVGDSDLVTDTVDVAPESFISGLHVVVIDDEAQIVKGMKTLLTDHGCHVTAAGDSDDALRLLEDTPRPPDILVCDYRLRDGKTGLDAVEKLRSAVDPELPAVLMAGDTHAQLLEEAEQHDLYVLHKPVKIPHLMKVIRELV